MSLEAATVVSVPSLGRSKMEDRKRAITSDHHDEMSPPAKRIATDVKPSSVSEPAADPIKFGTEGSPWQVELEVCVNLEAPLPSGELTESIMQTFQKDAILRQMREQKREKALLESQLADLEKRGRSHEDLLRFVESYIDQVGPRQAIIEITHVDIGAVLRRSESLYRQGRRTRRQAWW
jgi:E3 ubiquitin-protein ligase BRE1